MGGVCCNNDSIQTTPNVLRKDTSDSNNNANNDCKINREMFISESKESLSKKYKIEKKIGRGKISKIYKIRHIITGSIYALKIINKETMIGKATRLLKTRIKNMSIRQKIRASLDEVDRMKKNEVLILKKLEHPNIVRIYEYFIDDHFIYIIMEYINGINLTEYFSKLNYYNEYTAGLIMKQLFSAISYLNLCNVVHRDIKLDNIMIINNDEARDLQVKLIDFGTSIEIHEGEKLSQNVGTVYCMAPERLRRSYGKECDIWSAGVIMYFLLTGTPPFNSHNKEKKMENIMYKILNNEPDYESIEFLYISEEGKELMQKLLTKDPKARITASQALKDKWTLKYGSIKNSFYHKAKNKTDEIKNLNEVLLSLKNSINNFNSQQKLKQATVAFIVHKMSNNKIIRKLTHIFQEMNKSGDGLLTKEELKNGYKQYFYDNLTDEEFDEIMNVIDQDKNGKISIEEFLRATIKYENLINENNLKEAFEFFDKDHNGYLTRDELKEVFDNENNSVKAKTIEDILKEIDLNNDGKISYEEFKAMMIKTQASEREENNDGNEEDEDENNTNNMNLETGRSLNEVNEHLIILKQRKDALK